MTASTGTQETITSEKAGPMATKETRSRGLLRFSPFHRTRGDEEHLLKSPKNAARLLRALKGARERTGTAVTVEELRVQHGLEEK
jgi:hypothetical protein